MAKKQAINLPPQPAFKPVGGQSQPTAGTSARPSQRKQNVPTSSASAAKATRRIRSAAAAGATAGAAAGAAVAAANVPPPVGTTGTQTPLPPATGGTRLAPKAKRAHRATKTGTKATSPTKTRSTKSTSPKSTNRVVGFKQWFSTNWKATLAIVVTLVLCAIVIRHRNSIRDAGWSTIKWVVNSPTNIVPTEATSASSATNGFTQIPIQETNAITAVVPSRGLLADPPAVTDSRKDRAFPFIHNSGQLAIVGSGKNDAGATNVPTVLQIDRSIIGGIPNMNDLIQTPLPNEIRQWPNDSDCSMQFKIDVEHCAEIGTEEKRVYDLPPFSDVAFIVPEGWSAMSYIQEPKFNYDIAQEDKVVHKGSLMVPGKYLRVRNKTGRNIEVPLLLVKHKEARFP